MNPVFAFNSNHTPLWLEAFKSDSAPVFKLQLGSLESLGLNTSKKPRTSFGIADLTPFLLNMKTAIHLRPIIQWCSDNDMHVGISLDSKTRDTLVLQVSKSHGFATSNPDLKEILDILPGHTHNGAPCPRCARKKVQPS